jgi:hypothetical protein
LPQYGCVYHDLVRHPKAIKKQCAHDDMIEVVVNFTCVNLVNFFQIGAQTTMSKFGAKCAQIKGILVIF